MSDERICRICLGYDEPDQLLAPCACTGSSKWVHRFCLDEWRAQERVPFSFSHCSVCTNSYVFEERTIGHQRHRVKFGLLVTRDVVLFFFALQTGIAALAFAMHWIDRAINCPYEAWTQPCNYTYDANGTRSGGTMITRLYPREWADTNSVSRLRLGPYYVSAVLVLLIVMGIVGLWLWATGKLPKKPAPRVSSHWRQLSRPSVKPRSGHEAPDVRPKPRPKKARPHDKRDRCDCCDCHSCDCGYWECWIITDAELCNDNCNACCTCENCCKCECSECGVCDCSGDGGEAGVILLAVGIALAVIFVMIGVIVGIFVITIIFQRIVQSHIHLIAMRAEAKVYVVKNLADPSAGGEGVTFAVPEPLVTTTTVTTMMTTAPQPMGMDQRTQVV